MFWKDYIKCVLVLSVYTNGPEYLYSVKQTMQHEKKFHVKLSEVG